MLQTAETVAKRYNISKQAQDEYGVRSQLRAAAAQAAGKFKDEIVPMTTVMGVVDKATGASARAKSPSGERRGHPPRHDARGCHKFAPAMPGGVITAGNASQFSDGSSACVVMDGNSPNSAASNRLGIFRGFAVAGCEPDEMGIGPIYAVPRL